MNILLVVHCFFPDHFYGTETYTLELARELRRRGNRVEILSTRLYGESGDENRELFTYRYDDFTVHCVDYNHFPQNSFRDTYYRPENRPFYRELLAALDPDIIHVTHLMNHTPVLLEAARECGIPALATLTDFFPLCLNAHLSAPDGGLCQGPARGDCLECYLQIYGRESLADKGFLAAWLRRPGRRKMAAFLAARFGGLPFIGGRGPWRRVREITERAATIRQAYGIFRYLVTPTDFLRDAYLANRFPAAKLIKNNFGLNWQVVADWRAVRPTPDSSRPLRIGYIGQLVEHKGVDLLVEAFAALRGKRELVLYGSFAPGSPFRERLEGLAAGVAGVRFAGTFPETELGRRLSELDVLVIPSRWYENSPLVLLYALATRTPVVVSDVKGMTEFVRHRENGLTFARGSRLELQNALQELLDRPELVAEFSQRADYRRKIADHVAEIVTLYHEIVKERPAR